MRFSRYELQTGFEQKTFNISPESLCISSVEFPNLKAECILSCKPNYPGFKLQGHQLINYTSICDRCLIHYEYSQKIPIHLMLTQTTDFNNHEHKDLILFTEEMSEIDLSNYLKELIQLSKSIKNLCNQNCKGLCSTCGLNLNQNSCGCNASQKPTPFKNIEHLIQH